MQYPFEFDFSWFLAADGCRLPAAHTNELTRNKLRKESKTNREGDVRKRVATDRHSNSEGWHVCTSGGDNENERDHQRVG